MTEHDEPMGLAPIAFAALALLGLATILFQLWSLTR